MGGGFDIWRFGGIFGSSKVQ